MRVAQLQAFNADSEFVVIRDIIVNGKIYSPGDSVPKHLIRVRTLRQLYEQRKIGLAENQPERVRRPVANVIGSAKPNLDGPGPQAVKPKPPVRSVPADWRDLHWQKQAQLCAELGYVRPKNGAKAAAILEGEEARHA